MLWSSGQGMCRAISPIRQSLASSRLLKSSGAGLSAAKGCLCTPRYLCSELSGVCVILWPGSDWTVGLGRVHQRHPSSPSSQRSLPVPAPRSPHDRCDPAHLTHAALPPVSRAHAAVQGCAPAVCSRCWPCIRPGRLPARLLRPDSRAARARVGREIQAPRPCLPGPAEGVRHRSSSTSSLTIGCTVSLPSYRCC